MLFDEQESLSGRPRDRLIATLSAGEGSWRSAKLAKLLDPAAEMVLLFTDTLYEDADAYRFLIESAAEITGRSVGWVPRAEDFPDYRTADDVPIEAYAGNPEWRAFLSDLRRRAAREIPELVWLVEGRDPWEIYRDERFVGNNFRDPCSKILKRQQLAAWVDRHGNPHRDILIYGIGPHEEHRFDDGNGRGLRHRWAEKAWRCEAPLIACERACATEDLPRGALAIMASPVDWFGLRRSRLYGLGYAHNNCGGNCCKAGHAHWQHRLRVQPARFAYDALMERKLREFLGGVGTFLVDRRGGDTRPLSLDDFEARLRADPSVEYQIEPGASGCGCMLDEAA